MPINGPLTNYGELAARRKAWVTHFISIGCHPVKAESLTFKRMRKDGKWPATR